MSTENEQELATTGEPQDTNVDFAAQVEQLKATNERLLYESQANKTKRAEYDALKGELEAFKTKKLEEEGNLQELLNLERSKNNDWESKYKQQNEKILKSNVLAAVSKHASDAYDVKDLLKQDQVSMIEVNEETLEPIESSVQDFINSVKEQKSHLFKPGKIAQMADSKPGVNKPVQKSIKNMSDTERKAELKRALSQAFQPRG